MFLNGSFIPGITRIYFELLLKNAKKSSKMSLLPLAILTGETQTSYLVSNCKTVFRIYIQSGRRELEKPLCF